MVRKPYGPPRQKCPDRFRFGHLLFGELLEHLQEYSGQVQDSERDPRDLKSHEQFSTLGLV